ncbi:MAG: hypothetical protein ACKVS8_13040 [Phycisphaerales bacterium]
MSAGPTITPLSFRIAEAYGQVRSTRGLVAANRPADAPVAKVPDSVQRLVGGVVPGGVAFAGDATSAGARPGASLPFYRNPIAKNEAAVAVAVGRSLDVQA